MNASDDIYASGEKHVVVYFLKARSLGLIKVGVTKNLEQRLRHLAAMSPDALILMGLFDCHNYGRAERELHSQFSHLRAHGEWFNPGDDLVEWIAMNGCPATKRVLVAQRWLDYPVVRGAGGLARARERRAISRIQREGGHAVPPLSRFGPTRPRAASDKAT